MITAGSDVGSGVQEHSHHGWVVTVPRPLMEWGVGIFGPGLDVGPGLKASCNVVRRGSTKESFRVPVVAIQRLLNTERQ